MSTAELKATLHNLIDEIEDNSILNAVYALLSKITSKSLTKDWWNEISTAEKISIDEGLASVEKGEIYSHKEVMEEVKSKFNL